MIPEHCIFTVRESGVGSDGLAMCTPVAIGVVANREFRQSEDTESVPAPPDESSLKYEFMSDIG